MTFLRNYSHIVYALWLTFGCSLVARAALSRESCQASLQSTLTNAEEDMIADQLVALQKTVSQQERESKSAKKEIKLGGNLLQWKKYELQHRYGSLATQRVFAKMQQKIFEIEAHSDTETKEKSVNDPTSGNNAGYELLRPLKQSDFSVDPIRDGCLTDISYSPDGQLIASASVQGPVTIWQAHSHQKILSLQTRRSRTNKVAFSRKGTMLAAATQNKVVDVWSLPDGKHLFTLEDRWTAKGKVLGHKDWVSSASFSPDGKHLVTAGHSGLIVWEMKRGRQVYSLPAQDDGAVYSAEYSPDGKSLLTVHQSSKVKVLDAATGDLQFELKGPTAGSLTASYSGDGQLILTTARITGVHVWQGDNGEYLYSLRGIPEEVRTAEFSPDRRWIGVTTAQNRIMIFDARTGVFRTDLLLLKGISSRAVFAPDNTHLLLFNGNYGVEVWSLFGHLSDGDLE